MNEPLITSKKKKGSKWIFNCGLILFAHYFTLWTSQQAQTAAVRHIYFQTSCSLLSSFPPFLFFYSWEALIWIGPPALSLSFSPSSLQYGQLKLLFARESPAAIYAFMWEAGAGERRWRLMARKQHKRSTCVRSHQNPAHIAAPLIAMPLLFILFPREE